MRQKEGKKNDAKKKVAAGRRDRMRGKSALEGPEIEGKSSEGGHVSEKVLKPGGKKRRRSGTP